VDEYFEKFARSHYRPRTHSTVRSHLLEFFTFLRSEGIRSLNAVRPRTITAFLAWRGYDANGEVKPERALSAVSTFMGWLVHEGRRKDPNPVIARIHRLRQQKRSARPYNEEELGKIWRILGERGSALTRAAVAIGEESGLRINETCNLRLPDVDQKAQRLFVRLPNKTNIERSVPFHEKTRRYLAEWLKERDSSCGHDYLFHNRERGPLSPNVLWAYLRTIFDGYKSRKAETYEEVFKGFEYHRFRHTMTSRLASAGADAATLMALGGWRSWEGMQGYVRILPGTVEKRYREAMEKANEPPDPERGQVISLEEFGDNQAAKAASRER
jgi:site-specific recombinase XerD